MQICTKAHCLIYSSMHLLTQLWLLPFFAQNTSNFIDLEDLMEANSADFAVANIGQEMYETQKVKVKNIFILCFEPF